MGKIVLAGKYEQEVVAGRLGKKRELDDGMVPEWVVEP